MASDGVRAVAAFSTGHRTMRTRLALVALIAALIVTTQQTRPVWASAAKPEAASPAPMLGIAER